jgi:hypothetical protein
VIIQLRKKPHIVQILLLATPGFELTDHRINGKAVIVATELEAADLRRVKWWGQGKKWSIKVLRVNINWCFTMCEMCPSGGM